MKAAATALSAAATEDQRSVWRNDITASASVGKVPQAVRRRWTDREHFRGYALTPGEKQEMLCAWFEDFADKAKHYGLATQWENAKKAAIGGV